MRPYSIVLLLVYGRVMPVVDHVLESTLVLPFPFRLSKEAYFIQIKYPPALPTCWNNCLINYVCLCCVSSLFSFFFCSFQVQMHSTVKMSGIRAHQVTARVFLEFLWLAPNWTNYKQSSFLAHAVTSSLGWFIRVFI